MNLQGNLTKYDDSTVVSKQEQALFCARLLHFAISFPKGQIFFNYSPHVQRVEIRYYENGWEQLTEDTYREPTNDFYLYLDRLTIENVKEIQQWQDSIFQNAIINP